MSELLLQGKKAIITGASSGIGEALAYQCASQGAIVGLIARREEKLKSIVQKIKDDGGKAFYYQADVSQYFQIKAAVKNLIEKMDGVDILIPNAGVNVQTCPEAPNIDIKKLDQQDFDQNAKFISCLIDINLKGVFYTINACLNQFIKQRSGKIIATSSVMAEETHIKEPYFASTQSGIHGLTRGYSKLFENNKIYINSIMPSMIESEMMRKEKLGPLLPTDEIIPYYLYFASDKSTNETGRCINHDIFLRGIKLIKTLPGDQSRDWKEFEPTLKLNLDKTEYKHLRSNKKLLLYLLGFEKKQPLATFMW